MIFYKYIFFMFLTSLSVFILSLMFLINKMVLIMELSFTKLSTVKMEYLILFDWISLMFISIVLMISSMVLIYSLEYMEGDNFLERFMYLVILFVISMIFMIISPNMMSILLGWDGLGLISYSLVIYFQNENSFNSGMVTVLTNRIGDMMILIMMGFMLTMGSWSMMYLNNLSDLLIMMIIIAAFTKSAQIPFSSWLPLAMAAPTPVSSLVHSSTLVTAGVYLLIRFNYLYLDEKLNKILMFMSVMTLLLSGLSANFEIDLKKIIALSTLSQLGVMIFCLSLNLMINSLFHLMTHALFKSVLFMCAGVIIHNMLGNQDIRLINMVTFNMPIVSMIFNCASFSLCGMPFLSGFYSKDMILELFLMSSYNKMMFLVLFISMGFTVMYSIRLIFYAFIKFPKVIMFNNLKSLGSLMTWSMMILYFNSIFMGAILSWELFSMKNMIYLTISVKVFIFKIMFMGLLMGMLIMKFFSSFKFLKLMIFFMSFFFMMWFLPVIYSKYVHKNLKLSNKMIMIVEMGWVEVYLGKIMNLKFLKMMYLMELVDKQMFYFLNYIVYLIMILIY
uniref:NADH-ubiquinone oxidoreductase chain 5 n=1 Tax=Hypsicera sp. ZJUH_2016019 TaxID=2491161 RepID=A0A3Q8U9V3_9HYME|nr:NADH dehydrogenase subunit 5 [Hypsicera sp. ZJUH_2016019]